MPTVLFLLSLSALLLTLVPTIYSLDSAELTTGAYTLGIVHAPGYPLYVMVLHLFLQLPADDIGWLGNLFSALCLAASTPLVYGLLLELTTHKAAAISGALIFVWSYYVWLIGLFAEVYAFQVLTLSLCGYALVRLYRGRAKPIWVGLTYGVAVAAHPMSILFAPALIVAFRLLRVSWFQSFLAAGAGTAIFLLTLLYFPWRAEADFTLAGQYTAEGHFAAIDLRTFDGIWWILSGQQFESLFFEAGVLPDPARFAQMLGWIAGNFIGFGVVFGLWGIYRLWEMERGVLLVGFVAFVPYFYFFMQYGADDRDLMLAPLYFLCTIIIAYGIAGLPHAIGRVAWVAAPLILLAVNFPLVDLSDDTSVRDRSEALLAELPSDAIVFGQWTDVTPLEYLQRVEDRREDVTLYNIFLFPTRPMQQFVFASHERPMIFLRRDQARRILGVAYQLEALPVDWHGERPWDAVIIIPPD